MSQDAARHGPHARPEDEDVTEAQVRPPDRRQAVWPHQPVGRPAGDDDVSPDEPDEPDEPGESEFVLIGDDDLGAADLGPAAPNVRNPDSGSGRIRKVARNSLGDTAR
jgi:hypothetical protein